jgi:hypothetical protein
MNYIKKLAIEYAILNIIPMLEFRNNNEIYDIKINNKWYYFNPNKHNYNDIYDEVFYHIKTYFNLLSNMLDEEDKTNNNAYNTKKKEIKDIYKKADSKFINLIIKQIFEYVKKNVPNIAFNDSNDDIPLPVELTDIIYQYVPNDTNMDLINKIKNKIMLPKNEIIVELIKFFPHIENEPEIIKIYCKYVDLYSTEKIMKLLRHKFCDEYYAKKSFPKNNNGKPLPISKDDFKIFKKYLHLDKTTFGDSDQLTTSINFSMERLLYSEIKNLRQIKKFEKYDYLKNELKCFGEFTEIEIFKKIFAFDCQYKFYKNNWKTEIPELLSNTTNTLTSRDLYMIKQYPNWVKAFLEQLSINILNMITYFNKLVKYDKVGISMIEKLEKLIKLQNEYQYHNLQRCKNECKNELRKIEKFTK